MNATNRPTKGGKVVFYDEHPPDVPKNYVPNEGYVFGEAAVCPKCQRIHVFRSKDGIPGKGSVDLDRSQFKFFYADRYRGVEHRNLPRKQCLNIVCRKKAGLIRYEHFKQDDIVDVRDNHWSEWRENFQIDECVSDVDNFDGLYSVKDSEGMCDIYPLGNIRLHVGG